jgi:LacI family transcriptional regulator
MKKRRILYGVARNTYQRLEGALQYAHDHNWDLCVDTALTWHIPLRWQGDGILAYPAESNSLTDYVLSRPEPKVLVERLLPEMAGPRVVHDNIAAGTLAAEHFISKGFCNFAFVSLREMYFNNDQINGFKSRIEEAGHTASICTYPTDGNTPQPDQENWLRQILKKLPRPLALFAADDVLAVDIVHISRECGLRVPDDIAVLGTPNIPEIVERAPVPVSSVIMDEAGLIYRACALLDDILDGKQNPDNFTLVPPLGLAARASTDTSVFSNPLVRDGLAYIRDHCHEPIGVQEVADALNVDRRILSTVFKNVTGQTPHQAISAKRLEQVKYLLTTTDWPLPRIAATTGFTTHQYLCRFFKNATGISPSSYRSTTPATQSIPAHL